MPKGMCPAGVTLNSEKTKPVALAVIELHLSEGISQSVSQSVRQSVSQYKISFNIYIFKFHSNFLKVFWVDLKTCLGLVYLTNTASLLSGKVKAGFWVMFFHGLYANLCGLYYIVLTFRDNNEAVLVR